MLITVLGVGEASDPTESNASVVVASGGYRLLIDCGHSVPPTLWRRFPNPDSIDALIFTHHHPDHCFGLVPWLISLAGDGRDKPLEIVTTASGIDRLKRLCEIGMVPHDSKSPFPIHWRDIAELDRMGPCAVGCARTSHSMINHAIQLRADGARFAYSGDGRPTEESRALFAEADLLLHECYMAVNAPDMAYHADLATVRSIAGPPRIGVYHIRKDQRLLAIAELSGDPRVFVVRGDSEFQLGAD
jgi:ribonuclease BN (tRNA processing enzyme)